MKRKTSDDLLHRLIYDQISREEMEALLEGMDDEESIRCYEELLKIHFDQIMGEHTSSKREKK
jgi:Mg/Co/Ni transporter MgtE